MKEIQICPECGQPGVKVNSKAVKYNLKKSVSAKIDHKLKWNACINKDCRCSYYSGKQKYSIADMGTPLFYKDSSDNVPICYCSDLTRSEIKNAVRKGKLTTGAVRKFTHKTSTGHCDKMNPLGKCCKQILMKTIKDYVDVKPKIK